MTLRASAEAPLPALAGPECSVELWNCAVQAVLIEIVLKLNDMSYMTSWEAEGSVRG